MDVSVEEAGDGRTWEAAFGRIQEGVDAASDGDTVIVAPGIYRENVSFKGRNIVLRSTDPLDRSVVENTIIDGGQVGTVVIFPGEEDETCILSGFTIRNGMSGICGGGLSHTRASILNNRIIANSVGPGARGGGLHSCDGRIQGNIIRGNSSGGNGGGLYGCNGTIQSNVIMENTAESNGGGLCFCQGIIKNNLICGNSAVSGGGLIWCNGTIQNNTIVRNTRLGVVRCLGTIRNCTLWGNTAPGFWSPFMPELQDPQLFQSSIPTYSCIQDWSGEGEGNIAEDPQFVDPAGGDFRLQEDSPCVDTGVDYYWFAWPERDAEGNCRLAGKRVDMGCFEYGASEDADGDLLSDVDEGERGTDLHAEDTDGDSLRDGLEVLRGSDPLAVTAPEFVNVPSDVPGIQEGLCLAVKGDEIVVDPGTYRGNLQFCGLDVILRSWEPENPNMVAATILDGAAGTETVSPFYPEEAGRGPTVSFLGVENEACVLAGFTIRNGSGSGGGGVRGGTPAWRTGATIEHNLITENSAPGTYGHGGGLVFCDGLIRNNIICENSAERHAGLSHCDGIIQNNIIAANSGSGLAECHGIIRNNLIVGNSAGYGGGLYECHGMIENNTICGNRAYQGGGLSICTGTIRNCVVWNNSPTDKPQLGYLSKAVYSCIQGGSDGGLGNISLDPRFVDPDGADDDPQTYGDNDYRLLPDSPCIDAGENQGWMWDAIDLDGNPRIANGSVDMGAFESRGPPQVTITRDGDAVKLSWEGFGDGRYSVQWTDDLVSAIWQDAQEMGPISDLVWTDIVSSEILQRFYRVESAGIYSGARGPRQSLRR